MYFITDYSERSRPSTLYFFFLFIVDTFLYFLFFSFSFSFRSPSPFENETLAISHSRENARKRAWFKMKIIRKTRKGSLSHFILYWNSSLIVSFLRVRFFYSTIRSANVQNSFLFLLFSISFSFLFLIKNTVRLEYTMKILNSIKRRPRHTFITLLNLMSLSVSLFFSFYYFWPFSFFM